AIYNAGILTVNNNSILYYNLARNGFGDNGGYGGGIFNASNASATVTGSSLSDNFAEREGGGIFNGGTMTRSGCTVSDNYDYYGRGGGIFNDYKASATVTGSSLSDNVAEVGAGIFNDGTMTLSGSTLSGNHIPYSDGAGSGILNDSKGRLTIQ